MSDRTHDTKSNDQTAGTNEAAATAGRPSGAAMVHAMLAGGQRDPRVVAGVMQSHPNAAVEIVTLLNQTLGNRFVQAVLSFLSPGSGGSAGTATSGPSAPMRVTASGLHVRSSPDKASHENIIGTLPHHHVVQPTGQQGEWVAIEHDTTPAFVFGHYLEPAAKPHAHAHAKHRGGGSHATAETHDAAPTTTEPEHHEAAPVTAEAPINITAPPVPTPITATPPTTATTTTTPPTTTTAESKPVENPDPDHVAEAPKGDKAHKHHKGKHKEIDPKKPFSHSGGDKTHVALTKLHDAGQLKITARQVAQLDAMSKVETSGFASSVDTTDDQVVSLGFEQVVLGHRSLETIMKKVPGAFAKHGLELDTSKTYDFASKPHQIKGVPHEDELRGREWGMKFYDASTEPEVIGAIAEFALGELGEIDRDEKKVGATSNLFDDDTAQAWILELHNNRPAYTQHALSLAIANGAQSTKDRDQFLDILGAAIVDTYEIKETTKVYNREKRHFLKEHKKTEVTPEEDIALLEKAKEAVRRKGTNIITKISRHLKIPTLGAEGATTAGNDVKATPPPVTPDAGATEHHEATAEHHDAPPAHAEHHKADHHKHHHKPEHTAKKDDEPPPVATHDTTATTGGAGTGGTTTLPVTTGGATAGGTTTLPVTTGGATTGGATAKTDPVVANAVTAAGHIPGVTDAKPHVGDKALHTVIKPGDDLPSVYVSVPPGGVTGAVEVFLFLHGMYAHETPRKDMPIKDPNPEEAMNLAGAMAKTQRNLVTLAPIAKMVGDYPQWKLLEKHNGYVELIRKSIANLPPDAHSGDITVGSISIAGHSAGGQALGEASEQLGDLVHDMTMEDGGYGDNQKKHPGAHAWKDSHAKVVKWLLSGQTEKLLRVLLHGENNHSEGHVLDSNLNVESLTEAANKMGLANVKITKEVFAKHEKRSVKTMYLDHKLHITGLPAARTVSVFNMPGSNHMAVRNLATQALIEESRDTEFVAAGAAASTGTEVAEPKHSKHAKHKQADPEPTDTKIAEPVPTSATPIPTPDSHSTTPPQTTNTTPPTTAKTDAPPVEHATKAKHSKHSKHDKHKDEGPQPGDIVFADLTDLDAMVADVHSPQVTEVAKAVHALSDKSKELTSTQLDRHELKGPGRMEIVRMIRTIHAQIAGLTADVDAAKLAAIKGRMFRALQEVSPYHEQARNIDILENNAEMAARKKTGDKTRTCNITSLAMALEGLGRSPADYKGDKDKVLAAARHFKVNGVNIAAHSDLQGAGGGGTDWEGMTAMRMPDFLELSAIAHFMPGTDEVSVLAGADKAWSEIKVLGTLRDLASEFDVDAQVKYFAYDPTAPATGKHKKGTQEQHETKEADDLGDQSKDQRKKVDKLIDIHNEIDLESDPAKKAELQKKYDKEKAKLGSAMTDKKTGVDLERYKAAVIATIGAELSAGKAVETHVVAHYVRVRAIHEDHVVIDDPGRQARAHKNVRWDEARAEGLFDKRLVLS